MSILNKTKRKAAILYLGIGVLFVASIFIACVFGSTHVSFERVLRVLAQQLFGVQSELVAASDIYIIWNLRFPRALLAFAVGGGLAVAGGAMQSITRNVMADPYVLGISSGALAFVSIGFLIGGALTQTSWFIPLLAFFGALAALGLVFAIGGFSSTSSPTKLVLSGMAVSITLNAIAQYCIYHQQNGNHASSIVNWMMGSLGGARWSGIWIPFIGCILCTLYFTRHARAFDLIALGDETAISLGTNTRSIKRIALLMVAMISGFSVASCGIIGMIGFMIPHVVRFLIGTEHKRAFPVSFIVGGIFLILMDVLARTMLAPSEIPVGIFTALCGGPYFVWLLRKSRKKG